MSFRLLLTIGAVVLLILATTQVDTQHITWTLTWPIRLGLGGVGVLFALGAHLLRPAARRPDGGRKVDA
jgi:uncharacterized integral membrane protein